MQFRLVLYKTKEENKYEAEYAMKDQLTFGEVIFLLWALSFGGI